MAARIWLIAGPTASGKTALALRLAQASGDEIVGADALQLYRGLGVLSAAPTAAEQALVPHHLIGEADPAEAWSVGRWLREALEALEEIAARGRSAVVVGGTGLYFRALTTGLAHVPAIPRTVREETLALYESLGETAFRARLATVDPAAAARIGPGDRQRLTRAFEVWRASGRALSDWQAATSPPLPRDAWRGVVLDPPRPLLAERIAARLTRMGRRGALDEVRALLARRLSPSLPAMKAVALRPFAEHLAGKITLTEALERAAAESRRYAKRQATFLRHQLSDWRRIGDAEVDAQWRALIRECPQLPIGFPAG